MVLNAETKGERAVDASFQPGQLIDGKYRVERLIGIGGMAAVWAGTNERTGKRVALKVVLRSLASSPAARELFYSEGLVASRINHPNVVTIFDVIEHEGMTCMVMELLDGEPLSRLIERKGTLTAHEATWLLLPAMRGVAAAHAQGVIHRDLKPQNIFLCVEPSGRIVTTKVLDFGISVLMERVLDLSRGLFLGTPNYMSPEHVAGVAVIDGRADVYGFGVLLYEALTGQMAFPGEPCPALFQAIMDGPAVSVASLRPDLPTGLVSIIDRAMSKHPEHRYASVTAMITALEVELLALGLGGPSPSALPGATDPMVNAAARDAGVLPPHQDTMVLYTFPGQESDAKSSEPMETSGPEAIVDTADTMVVNFRAGILTRLVERDWSLPLGWKAALATALGVVLAVVVWNATRPTVPPDPVNPGASTEAVPTAPTIVPLASPEPVAVPPVAEIPEPVAAEPEAASEIPAPSIEHKKPGRARSAMVASAARARVDAQASAKEKSGTAVVPTDSVAVPTRANPVTRFPIRAGSLSTDDF